MKKILNNKIYIWLTLICVFGFLCNSYALVNSELEQKIHNAAVPYYTYTFSAQTSFSPALDYTKSITFHRCAPPPSTGGGGCFLAGTPVTMADGTTLPIEELKIGDMVLAFDQDTGMFQPDAVKNVFVFPENDEGYLTINKRIKVTPHHRFYIKDQWVEAGKLKEGDILLTKEGKPETITSIEYTKATQTVYNLEVNPYHTFIAGDVVVHNMSAVLDSTGRVANLYK